MSAIRQKRLELHKARKAKREKQKTKKEFAKQQWVLRIQQNCGLLRKDHEAEHFVNHIKGKLKKRIGCKRSAHILYSSYEMFSVRQKNLLLSLSV